jgi:hypothetical protein
LPCNLLLIAKSLYLCSMGRLIGILFVIISLPAAAQQNFVSISFGTSLPLGNYGSTGSLDINGFASPGGVIKFDAGYYPVTYLGFGATFSFGSNYAVRDSILSSMVRYIEANSVILQQIPDDAEIIYATSFWNHIDLLVGPVFSVRLSKRLYLDFRALFGPTVFRPPGEELRILFDDSELRSSLASNLLLFGVNGGTGLRIKLNDAISLKLGAEYYRSRARFPYEFSLLGDMPDNIPPLEADLLIQTIELSAGLAYSF